MSWAKILFGLLKRQVPSSSEHVHLAIVIGLLQYITAGSDLDMPKCYLRVLKLNLKRYLRWTSLAYGKRHPDKCVVTTPWI
jgi:hypothetical protein